MLGLDPKRLARPVLVQALFENAILHAQNFAKATLGEQSLSEETRVQIASQISEYAFAIMVFYFQAGNHGDLQTQVQKKHEDFLRKNCGTNSRNSQESMVELWREEIRRKVTWLGMGGVPTDLEKDRFAENILADSGFRTGECQKLKLKPFIEQFVENVHLSMKHFGIRKQAV
jgi:hypothetical protein